MFLSKTDVAALTKAFAVNQDEFMAAYCRWVRFGERELVSLKEKANLDCIFWEDGCSVYEARPLQCRTFPFWESVLASRDSWEHVVNDCPGVGNGSLHSFEEIEALLRQREAAPAIERKAWK